MTESEAHNWKRNAMRKGVFIVPCKFNPLAVDCDLPFCARCGWNPAVEEERKARIREQHVQQCPE